jgi:hypothetical protein
MQVTSQLETIIRLHCVTIYFDPEIKMSKVVWHGIPLSEEYRKAYNTLLDFAKTHQIENTLTDIRDQGVVSIENRKWFEEYVFPEGIKLGLKRAAVITSSNPFKTYYLNMILKVINKFGIPIKLFGSQEQAEDWFRSFYK